MYTFGLSYLIITVKQFLIFFTVLIEIQNVSSDTRGTYRGKTWL